MKREEAEAKRYQTFEDLLAYQVAREFRKAMYGVAKRLPDLEKLALADQVRRAAVSLTNNIAEGHGRFHFLEQIKFMLQARGSLEELLDDLNVCADEEYLHLKEIESHKMEAWRVHKLINGYIRFLRNRKAGESSRVQETEPATDWDEIDGTAEATAARFNPSSLQPFNE